MGRSRQFRRHQRKRKKAWAKRILTNNPMYKPEVITDHVIGLVAATPKRCSSWCCGNPRKWFGSVTAQEKRAVSQ